jgi:myeloid differentiation primary response protein MyD88
MAEAMAEYQLHKDIPSLLTNFKHYPLSIVNASSRSHIAWRLDPERTSFDVRTGLLQDWRGFAEARGFSQTDIYNFNRSISPTLEVFQHWETRCASPTIGDLLTTLHRIGRLDILNDTQFQQLIAHDVESFESRIASQSNPVQVDEVGSTSEVEFHPMTVNEAMTGVAEHFDAYICSTVADSSFVYEMIYHLEQVQRLKLFIAERDSLAGSPGYPELAKIIKNKCRKMIIVLSPDYLQSEECKFATRFAFSLHPGADQRTLIPVMYRKCSVPDILAYITLLDYTRQDIKQWFWTRLASSLISDSTRNNIIAPPGVLRVQPATAPVASSAPMVQVEAMVSSVTAPARLNSAAHSSMVGVSDTSDSEMEPISIPDSNNTVSTILLSSPMFPSDTGLPSALVSQVQMVPGSLPQLSTDNSRQQNLRNTFPFRVLFTKKTRSK